MANTIKIMVIDVDLAGLHTIRNILEDDGYWVLIIHDKMESEIDEKRFGSYDFDLLLINIDLLDKYQLLLEVSSRVIILLEQKIETDHLVISELQKKYAGLICKPVIEDSFRLSISKALMFADARVEISTHPRILIVEQDDLVLYSAMAILEEYFEVIGCSSMDEGLSLLRSNAFEVLIIDIADGKKEAFSQVRLAKMEQPTLLIILMTSLSNNEIVMSAINEGVNDFIEKPLRPDLLIRAVNRVWQLGQSLVINQHLVTALSLNNSQLRKTGIQLKQFVEHSPVALAMFDTKMNYLVTSQVWLKMFNIDQREKLIGKNFLELMPRFQSIDIWRETFEHCLRGKDQNVDEYLLKSSQDKEDWVTWKAGPWSQENGVIGGVIIVAEVITGRKLAELKRIELEEQLFRSEKLKAIGQFAGGLFHDLNKLLTPVVGNVELVKMQIDDRYQTEKQYLDEVLDNIDLIQLMAKQLMSIVREAPIELVRLNITQVVQQAVTLVKNIVPENIDFVSKINQQVMQVMADEAGIIRIVLNLISNSADAIKDNRGRIILLLDTIDPKEFNTEVFVHENLSMNILYVKLTIKDNGPGIEKSILDHIFDPLKSTKHSDGGTGLGLSVVMHTVKKLNGFINVTSELGQGTVFTVYIPIAN